MIQLYSTSSTHKSVDMPFCALLKKLANHVEAYLISVVGFEQVKDGVVDEGMVGFRFNTIGVSDGISMGTSGENFACACFVIFFPFLCFVLNMYCVT